MSIIHANVIRNRYLSAQEQLFEERFNESINDIFSSPTEEFTLRIEGHFSDKGVTAIGHNLKAQGWRLNRTTAPMFALGGCDKVDSMTFYIQML